MSPDRDAVPPLPPPLPPLPPIPAVPPPLPQPSASSVATSHGPLTRLRARLTVAKAGFLFLLPLPLVFAIIGALVGDDTGRLALASASLACFWSAGVLAWRGLAQEMRYALGEQAELDRLPRKLLSAALTAGGAGMTALAAGHRPLGAATFAAVGGVGHLCFYGVDQRGRRITVAQVDGVDLPSITEQLEQAHRRLRRIDAAARAIAVPEFQSRLARITQVGRDILAKIERDPRDATRARRFLHLYLDSTERVTQEYAKTHKDLSSRPLEENFRKLLVEMEGTFSEQYRKLLESDAVSLDVEIEVLNARLKQEGLGNYVEKRA